MTIRECEDVSGRLIAGDKAGDDPVLAAHVGSCLQCFRTAADLRDLPRLESLLRRAQPVADPGDAFWAAFPRATAKAWQKSRAGLGTRTSGAIAPSGLRRVRDWLRLPVPAALLGAAVACAVVFMLVPARHPPGVVAVGTQPAAPTGISTEVESTDSVLGSLETLEVADLAVLQGALAEETRPVVPPADEIGEPSVTATERVEALDADDLSALSLALRKSNPI